MIERVSVISRQRLDQSMPMWEVNFSRNRGGDDGNGSHVPVIFCFMFIIHIHTVKLGRKRSTHAVNGCHYSWNGLTISDKDICRQRLKYVKDYSTRYSQLAIIHIGPSQWLKWGGLGGLSPPPASTLAEFGTPPLLESEPSIPTAGPKLLNSTKNHNVRCRINKF